MTPETEKAIHAAQGYLELGMPEETLAELAEISPQERSETEVLEVEIIALLNQKRWLEALGVSRDLCENEPTRASGFINAAYCLHESGSTKEAQEFLLNGPESLRKEATFFYNLGCYAARLDDLPEAQQLLAKAFEMDERLRVVAKDDPDLAALRATF
ncbi:MAG: putative Zn-dependent protease [Verrucomicrobiales bacterium]|jgi:predicted Zn-dependent protease